RQGTEDRRPLRGARAGARRQADRGRRAQDRHQRRIRRLAGDARHRRLRPQDFRDPRLSARPGARVEARHERLRRLEAAAMTAPRLPAAPLPPGLIAVAWRELRWIWHDRIALFLVAGVPLFAITVLSLTFSNAVIRELSVDVVDADRTPTSAIFVQAV